MHEWMHSKFGQKTYCSPAAQWSITKRNDHPKGHQVSVKLSIFLFLKNVLFKTETETKHTSNDSGSRSVWLVPDHDIDLYYNPILLADIKKYMKELMDFFHYNDLMSQYHWFTSNLHACSSCAKYNSTRQDVVVLVIIEIAIIKAKINLYSDT